MWANTDLSYASWSRSWGKTIFNVGSNIRSPHNTLLSCGDCKEIGGTYEWILSATQVNGNPLQLQMNPQVRYVHLLWTMYQIWTQTMMFLDYRREMRNQSWIVSFRYTAHNRCTYLKAPPRSWMETLSRLTVKLSVWSFNFVGTNWKIQLQRVTKY